MYASQHFYVCMVLKKMNSWNTMFISEQGAFPFVIVQVWQWGAWKCAPM